MILPEGTYWVIYLKAHRRGHFTQSPRLGEGFLKDSKIPQVRLEGQMSQPGGRRGSKVKGKFPGQAKSMCKVKDVRGHDALQA